MRKQMKLAVMRNKKCPKPKPGLKYSIFLEIEKRIGLLFSGEDFSTSGA
jgi:hypothetical protein